MTDTCKRFRPPTPRVSHASCYQKAGDPSRATSLYCTVLAGPLREVARGEAEAKLANCLALLRNGGTSD